MLYLLELHYLEYQKVGTCNANVWHIHPYFIIKPLSKSADIYCYGKNYVCATLKSKLITPESSLKHEKRHADTKQDMCKFHTAHIGNICNTVCKMD